MLLIYLDHTCLPRFAYMLWAGLVLGFKNRCFPQIIVSLIGLASSSMALGGVKDLGSCVFVFTLAASLSLDLENVLPLVHLPENVLLLVSCFSLADEMVLWWRGSCDFQI